jgi:hypothetical protein
VLTFYVILNTDTEIWYLFAYSDTSNVYPKNVEINYDICRKENISIQSFLRLLERCQGWNKVGNSASEGKNFVGITCLFLDDT